MRPMLRWSLLGCGCISSGLVALVVGGFIVLVGLEVAGIQVVPTPASKPITAAPPPTLKAQQIPTTPVPSATPLPKLGQTVTMTTPAGLRLQVTVMGIEDDVAPGKYAQPAKGRYVAVDWSLKNDGAVDVEVNRLDLKIQTSDNHVLQRGTVIREPDLDTSKLGPGQAMRGWLTYDVPRGARVRSAIYQPFGARQFVIADFGL